MHHGQEEKPPLFTAEEAKHFADRAICPVPAEHHKPLRSCCVDGRYAARDAKDAPLARPGADAGDLMIVLAALRTLGLEADIETRREAIAEVVAAAGGAEAFRFHTDDHSADLGIARGCGHLRKAEGEPEAYGLAAEDMKEVFAVLGALKASGAAEVVLRGGHGERGVMVVKDAGAALLHEVQNVQAFVYQEALHHDRLRDLAERLAALPALRDLPQERILKALAEASELQLGATLVRLAPNYPVYGITSNGNGGVEIAQTGTVPAHS